MSHEDEGDAGLPLQRLQLAAHRLAELEVERRERLVEQEHLRPGRDGAGEGHALLLSAGKLRWTPGAVVRHLDQRQRLVDRPVDLVLRPSLHAQAEAHVLGDGHVREQRIVLEHRVDRPFVGRQMGDVEAVQQDLAGSRELETAIRRSSVVLPQPEGPSKVKNSFSPDGDGHVVKAFTPPGKTFDTPRASTADCPAPKE